MSSETRHPLQPISTNIIRTFERSSVPKLAPIFLRTPRPTPKNVSTPVIQSSPDLYQIQTPPSSHIHLPASPAECSYTYTTGFSRKRVKIQEDLIDVDESDDELPMKRRVKSSSISDFFLTSTPSRNEHHSFERVKEAISRRERVMEIEETVVPDVTIWRKPRRRMGVRGVSRPISMMDTARIRPVQPLTPYLKTLVTSLAPYNPLTPPSILFLPSLHAPLSRPRDYSPAIAVAFNSVAKTCTADEAKQDSRRRLIAVAGEEGGVRIIDVDEGLGDHREEKGFWWRAHANAVFDVQWSSDDSRLLTASGDRTTRLHALTSPTPTLLATLRGHTSSIKTAVFFDPSRSHTSSPSTSSSIVASAGRDGNIMIYDLRCQGTFFKDGSDMSIVAEDETPSRRKSRDRYSAGIPGFTAQQSGYNLDPVMVIKQPHGEPGSRRSVCRTATRSVTSLVALEAMPGILASGGSFDGIVKLWDLRFHASSSRSPDPRPTCTPVASLADPTISAHYPSRRPRSINALCEQPSTGDLFALCGDSKIHTLRPSAAKSSNLDTNPTDNKECILPKTYTDPDLLVSSFYVKMAISADGRYLTSGSCKGGIFTWDTQEKANAKGQVGATRLGMGMGGVCWPDNVTREIGAVAIGKDLLAACSDDLATRIWRPNLQASKWLLENSVKAGAEWAGPV